jgi:hypothetical protein
LSLHQKYRRVDGVWFRFYRTTLKGDTTDGLNWMYRFVQRDHRATIFAAARRVATQKRLSLWRIMSRPPCAKE